MPDGAEKEPLELMDGENQEQETMFPVRGYVILNLCFWAFCVVEILIVRWWLKDIQGVIFFFLLLAIGFTAVSVYDGLYDRMTLKRRNNPPTASSPK